MKFKCVYIDSKGTETTEEIEADSEKTALLKLTSKGLFCLEITPVNEDFINDFSI